MLQKQKDYTDVSIIDIDWIMEALEEKFDDILTYLEPSCIIYGGALRDLMAGLTIGGDLDIGVPTKVYDTVYNSIDNSARWINKKETSKVLNKQLEAYAKKTKQIVTKLNNFVNINGADIQLICPKSLPDVSLIDEAFTLARNVDIACCGIAMDMSGDVYEVVPGAYNDCKKKILRVNSLIDITNLSLENLKKRITKFINRGWTNEINVKEIEEIIKCQK